MLETASGSVRTGLLQRLRHAGSGRLGFVRRAVPEGAGSLIDIGCGEGWVIGERDDIARRVGVDTDREILARARALYPGMEFQAIDGGALPFVAASFDYAVLSEVIEHVGDQNKQSVIDEALRVLRPGGRLILTAPHAGLFAFLDPLDVKRRLPRLYRVYQRFSKREPLTPAETGHKHVTLDEIEALIAGRAALEGVEFSGPLTPLADIPLAIAVALGRPADRLGRLQAWAMSVPSPRVLASDIRLVAVRR